MQVKPGCVITDVARPRHVPEDIAKRPDVLVIESGEIELPGEVRMKSIGLPDRVAYACLAETIVLALEGRSRPSRSVAASAGRRSRRVTGSG